MGRRKAKRVQVELPVSVSGFDVNGNPFVQSARTLDISWCGVRLKEIHCVRGPGDTVRVQYKDKKGRYRVVWMEQETGTLGLEGVEGAKQLFGDHLPPSGGTNSEVDTYSEPPPPPAVQSAASSEHGVERRGGDRREGERRRHKRYNCVGTASVRETDSQFGASGRVLDISLSGCYIEMLSPMRVGTSVVLDIQLSGHALSLAAIVRMAHSNMGMGVEFTGVPPDQMEKLELVIAELSGTPRQAASPAVPSQVESGDAEQVGAAILRWFATHDQLTREDLQKLLRENKKPS